MPNNNPNGGQQWHDDHCAELTRLLATGMIYREIARAINEKFGTNFSKNSVVGKVCRLGLTPPEKPKAPPYVRKPKPRRAEFDVIRIVSANGNSNGMRVLRTVVLEQAKLRCVEIVPRHLSLIELEPGDCRYPYGDGPMTFCGHPKLGWSSYCIAHHALCHETPRVPIYRFVGRDAA
jgi:GcrA cell cycle regulator